MIFFRFISLSRIFVACILIISAMPSSAQDLRDRFTSSLEWNLIRESWYALQYIFKVIKYQKTPELYLFLKEAQDQNEPKFQLPEKEIGEIFKRKHATAPVKESYLGYYKLHNISMSTPWRQAIAWRQFILYVHSDNKVSGWVLSDKPREDTFETYAASKDLTNAFLGKIADDKITFNFVTKEGEPASDGCETFEGLKWNDVHDVLKGTWKGNSEHVSPKNQQGNVYINMHSHNYREFDVNEKLISEFEKEPEKFNETNILAIEKNISSLKDINTAKLEDIKLVITWYTVKAWEAYEGYLPEDLKGKMKKEILDFRVGVAPQVYSFDKHDDNGEKLPVPMNFAKSPISEKYNLYISTKTFFSDEVENENKFKSKLSLIAHEILGHGIFFRYYSTFVNKEKGELDRYTKFKKYIHNNFMNFEILGFEHDELKYENLKSAMISEGLAVAVEYTAYKSGHKNSPSKIEDFTKIRYSSNNGERYRDGVTYLKKKGIITEEGKLDFEKLNASNQ